MVARSVASFWEQVGEAQPVTIEAAAHDTQLAWTSHLPQAVASALAEALGARALGGVSFGPGGRDTTRLAASDPDLWAEIFLANAGPVTEALGQTGDALQELRSLISARRRRRVEGLPGARCGVPPGPRSMRVHGSVRVPGDKSITHRALLFGALARGQSYIGGALTSLDARSSARVLRQLGAEISPLRIGSVIDITGRGRLRRPGGRAQLRQLRHHDSTAARDARGTPFRRHAHGRQFPPSPPDAAGDGSAGTDGRALQ